MATKSFFLNTLRSSTRILNPRGAIGSSGGQEIVVETFANSTSWVCPTGVTSVEYLIVAGGGGGGPNGGGGGGAGGFRTGTGYAVTAGNTYTITVGAGGNASPSSTSRGSSGSDSVFDIITSNNNDDEMKTELVNNEELKKNGRKKNEKAAYSCQ